MRALHRRGGVWMIVRVIDPGRGALIALGLAALTGGLALLGRQRAGSDRMDPGEPGVGLASRRPLVACGVFLIIAVGFGAQRAPRPPRTPLPVEPLRVLVRAPVAGERVGSTMSRSWEALGLLDADVRLLSPEELCREFHRAPIVCMKPGGPPRVAASMRELARTMGTELGGADCVPGPFTYLFVSDRIDDLADVDLPATGATVRLSQVDVSLRVDPATGGGLRLTFAGGGPPSAVDLTPGVAARARVRLGPVSSVDLWARLNAVPSERPRVTLFGMHVVCG